ncbi:hypothetical protein [Vibrio sp. SCSIO 43155]|uniref:hypothetical protein n=1 Tax=Vibrio sp. SCSIO 43155 TaxID=2819099 RepID=UPI0020755B2D|nr:hypothetical protein [Vibrio sp. SCSIO 43155]USD58692.1 hypothetical protein J4N44_27450 [Vibrio sp. SCSIO 43155]
MQYSIDLSDFMEKANELAIEVSETFVQNVLFHDGVGCQDVLHPYQANQWQSDFNDRHFTSDKRAVQAQKLGLELSHYDILMSRTSKVLKHFL